MVVVQEAMDQQVPVILIMNVLWELARQIAAAIVRAPVLEGTTEQN